MSKNMQLVPLTILFTLIFALILLTPGCGSSSNQASSEEIEAIKEKNREKEKDDRAAHQKMIAAKNAGKEKKRREIEKRRAEAEASRLRLRNQSRTSEHPALYSDWADKDFYVAKVEQDRRLFRAIEYLSDYCKDSDQAVRLLGELITPGTPLSQEEFEEIGGRLTYKYDKQVRLLAKALVACNTNKSIELVDRIVSRETPTDAPGVAIPNALRAIAENPTELNEPIFLDAFRERVDGTDKLLQTIIASGASGSFRITLAEYSMASSCYETQRQAIWSILCKDDPRNLPATLLLYRDDRLPESYCKILERQFAGLAQSAVSRVCGFPSEVKNNVSKKQKRTVKNRQAQSRRTADTQGQLTATSADWVNEAELIKQVKTNLWNDQFATLLAKRLYQVDSLEGDNQLILLAMNTPRDKPRKMLGELLLRNWQENPAKLRSIGFPEKVVVEPGFWLVAKHALNESRASKERMPKRGQRSRRKAGHQEKAMNPTHLAWKHAFGKMLVAMCGRLEAAGRPVYSLEEVTDVSTSIASETKPSSEVFTMESLLHTKARPVTECKIQMPNDSLSLHYLRCEELARPDVILKHYRGKLSGASELSGPTLCWLGSLVEEEPAKGKMKRFHSVDVLLKIEQPATGNLSDKMELSIEILLISSPFNSLPEISAYSQKPL